MCPGPCDVSSVQPNSNFPKVTRPELPAAVYERGEQVTIKYQRNNHGPGGFVRLSLVPVEKMMNKNVHEENAFHFSCWGSDPVKAKPNELGRDKQGFSLVGGDGKLHDGPISYYTTNIIIPRVIPDGDYVIGWVWYGGMGGSIQKNLPETPHETGLFADYWSCSFVKIEGGPIEQSYTPVFVNAFKKFWAEGCNSANDHPGVCKYEPCIVPGKIQKPREFKNGTPKPLKPQNFASDFSGRISPIALPTPVPESQILEDANETLKVCESKLSEKLPRTGAGIQGVMTDIYRCNNRNVKLEEEKPLLDETEVL